MKFVCLLSLVLALCLLLLTEEVIGNDFGNLNAFAKRPNFAFAKRYGPQGFAFAKRHMAFAKRPLNRFAFAKRPSFAFARRSADDGDD